MVSEIPLGTSPSSSFPPLSIHLRISNYSPGEAQRQPSATQENMASPSSSSSSDFNRSSKILVIGAGTWGASTALHLARRGYTNVTVLDSYPQPSAISAGNDVNKIVSFSEVFSFLIFAFRKTNH